MIRSYVGIAKIVTPSAVRARIQGAKYHNGAILVACPEAGFQGTHLIYCRYGLSVPYAKLRAGQTIWIEPTRDDNERWKYTGYADCGGYEPEDSDILVIGDFEGEKFLSIDGDAMTLQAPDHVITDGAITIHGLTHIHPTVLGPSGPPTAGT